MTLLIKPGDRQIVSPEETQALWDQCEIFRVLHGAPGWCYISKADLYRYGPDMGIDQVRAQTTEGFSSLRMFRPEELEPGPWD